MIGNTELIERCAKATSKEDCYSRSPVCEWLRGKVEASNIDFVDGGELFENNFCHPPSAHNINETISMCSPFRNKDQCS
jgi:hypothetical protein